MLLDGLVILPLTSFDMINQNPREPYDKLNNARDHIEARCLPCIFVDVGNTHCVTRNYFSVLILILERTFVLVSTFYNPNVIFCAIEPFRSGV